jgi:hypothetical protein
VGVEGIGRPLSAILCEVTATLEMKVRKITVTPVPEVSDPLMDGESFPASDLPFEVYPDVFLADVHEQVKNADYSLWARDFLSKEDVKKLQGWRYALIHYFDAEEYSTSRPDENSKTLVQRVFLGLRIVRPSWTPYQYLRAIVRPDGSFAPGAFSQALKGRLTVPSCDAVNRIRRKDAELLRAVMPALIEAYDTKCEPVSRAMRILELGYLIEFIDVKQLLWTTALDALFTSARHWGSDIAIRRIKNFVGADARIYDPADFPSHVTVPPFTVNDVAWDVYRLRNKFAHGEWIPKEYLGRRGYVGKAGNALTYADVILEATSIILRKSLIRVLKENLLEVFRSKDALDWHFSRQGLITKKKSPRGFSGREPSFH